MSNAPVHESTLRGIGGQVKTRNKSERQNTNDQNRRTTPGRSLF
jgi:hypothetical protein